MAYKYLLSTLFIYYVSKKSIHIIHILCTLWNNNVRRTKKEISEDITKIDPKTLLI